MKSSGHVKTRPISTIWKSEGATIVLEALKKRKEKAKEDSKNQEAETRRGETCLQERVSTGNGSAGPEKHESIQKRNSERIEGGKTKRRSDWT